MTSPRLLTLLLCALAQLAGGPALAQSWAEYRNERYGLSLRYPADIFVAERAAEAGDGQAFVAKDADARLLVGALRNESSYTPAAYRDYIAQTSYAEYQIDYRRLGGNWFALSGEGNGRIFYEKVMFTCGGRLINSFAMLYPSDQRHIFDPIVERIEDTFQPARDCERAGLAAPSPAQPAAPQRPREQRQYGERSALADRIARARGRDVVVVVRRTSPPYDRKILRGYVSRP